MLERVRERATATDHAEDLHRQAPVGLLSVALATPPHRIPQDLAQTLAGRIFGDRYPDFAKLSKTFDNSGIEARYSVSPPDWFMTERRWPERNRAYLEGAVSLYRDAAEQALRSAAWSADEIDCLVTVSSTGIATPTLEARVLFDLGFRHDVKRVPVFGLGCAGGVTGLSIAARMARAEPGSKVLLVCLELCTLSFRADRLRKADIIAAALFGDGAAAVCLSVDDAAGAQILDQAEYTWPDTLNIMGWDADDLGLGVIFDRSIPGFLSEHLPSALDGCLEAMASERARIDRFVCHPGGAKVVQAIETSLGLPDGKLDVEREVLRRYGNMSAPTVLFVLEQVLRRGVGGMLALTALGPGFTLSTLTMSNDG